MPITEKICITCSNIFKTLRATHKNRNPIFCSTQCVRSRSKKGNPGFKWRLGQGFWQTANEEQKFNKLKELYFKNVIINDGCWGWKSVPLSSGYGKLGMGKGKTISSHRFSWILHNGLIENNLFVLHKCDNKICTNPEHLFLGTSDDNMKDLVSKNKQNRGENVYCVKLNEQQVRDIRKLIKSGECNYKISKIYNVNSGTIQNIAVGRTWKHVKDDI